MSFKVIGSQVQTFTSQRWTETENLILPHFTVSKFYQRSFTSLILGKLCQSGAKWHRSCGNSFVRHWRCRITLVPITSSSGLQMRQSLSHTLTGFGESGSSTKLHKTWFSRLLRKTGREAQPWLIYREDSVLKLKGSYFWQYAKKWWRGKMDMVLFVYLLIRKIPVLPSTRHAQIA